MTSKLTITDAVTAHLAPDRWWPVQIPGIGLLRDGLTPVRVSLIWNSRHPYEVAFRFQTGRRRWVTWLVARELVALGLIEPVEDLVEPLEDQRSGAGQGDVRFAPVADFLLMTLDSPSGYARFLFDTDTVAGFLSATYRHTPLGAEQIDVPGVEFFTSPAGGGLW